MRARLARPLTLLLAALAPGCMSGLIYTHTTSPLSTNFDRTPVATGNDCVGKGQIDHLHVPVSNIDFDVLWNSNAIGDAAKREGLESIYYADLETFSILGIWNEYTVHVYGKPGPKS